jgi:cytoskeletal protein CcmA (bactofilin family)
MAMRTAGWRKVLIGAPGEAARADEPARPAPGAAPSAPAPEESYARIERGVEMSGRLATERPLRIEGEFRGEIQSASAVLVCEGGTVEAPIRARAVEIHGAVVGDVVASREVVIHASGRLHGDVEAPSLVIARGAFFNGRTKMYRPERVVQAEAAALEAAALEAAAPVAEA